jgi:hypothetical protein
MANGPGLWSGIGAVVLTLTAVGMARASLLACGFRGLVSYSNGPLRAQNSTNADAACLAAPRGGERGSRAAAAPAR